MLSHDQPPHPRIILLQRRGQSSPASTLSPRIRGEMRPEPEQLCLTQQSHPSFSCSSRFFKITINSSLSCREAVQPLSLRRPASPLSSAVEPSQAFQHTARLARQARLAQDRRVSLTPRSWAGESNFAYWPRRASTHRLAQAVETTSGDPQRGFSWTSDRGVLQGATVAIGHLILPIEGHKASLAGSSKEEAQHSDNISAPTSSHGQRATS